MFKIECKRNFKTFKVVQPVEFVFIDEILIDKVDNHRDGEHSIGKNDLDCKRKTPALCPEAHSGSCGI